MAQIVKPEMIIDLGSLDGSFVSLLDTANRLLEITRRRKYERSFLLFECFDFALSAEIQRRPSSGGPSHSFCLPERVENRFLSKVNVLNPNPKYFFRSHARVEHNFRDVAEWLAPRPSIWDSKLSVLAQVPGKSVGLNGSTQHQIETQAQGFSS
jgi:hypothetical protein